MDIFNWQKISKDMVELNNAISLLDITYIYRLLHPAPVESTLFSKLLGTFTKIDYILGYKTHLTNLK